MPDSPAAHVSDAFRALFRASADASGVMTFERFMELALYHPQLGYYRRDRSRVGYAPGTDFYTASTSGPVFGELVAAACVSLLGPDVAREHRFIEIGAESPTGVLAGVAHPFVSAEVVQLGEDAALAGRCIVFSNELFDAQPFRRFVFRDGAWREFGVAWRDDTFSEIELPLAAPPPAPLPPAAPDGYVVDAPLAAAALLERLARRSWSGLFVAFDYGKSWTELLSAHPAGTARAYHRHRQSNDLLAQPGEQDLTCHVCWDWLSAALTDHGFDVPTLESQEVFFVRRAADYIARASTEDAAGFSRRKLSLLQLLHPGHLGQKFQVLHALRAPTA